MATDFQNFYILCLVPWIPSLQSATLFREEGPLSTEQQVLLNPGVHPWAAKPCPRVHHGGSLAMWAIACLAMFNPLEWASVWSCHQPLTIFAHSLGWSLLLLVVRTYSRHDSPANSRQRCILFRLPSCNFHSMHDRKLSVDTIDAKFQPSKPYSV